MPSGLPKLRPRLSWQALFLVGLESWSLGCRFEQDRPWSWTRLGAGAAPCFPPGRLIRKPFPAYKTNPKECFKSTPTFLHMNLKLDKIYLQ